jgi:hypothetical protein
MESYQKYGTRALPKMPILKDIVLSFPWINNPVYCECLLTNVGLGIGGRTDRIVMVDDTYRIEDYKFNVESEIIDDYSQNKLFPELPANKISKCLIQLSIYADLLEMSDYPVCDTVVTHVWDGQWKHYPDKRIPNIISRILEFQNNCA